MIITGTFAAFALHFWDCMDRRIFLLCDEVLRSDECRYPGPTLGHFALCVDNHIQLQTSPLLCFHTCAPLDLRTHAVIQSLYKRTSLHRHGQR